MKSARVKVLHPALGVPMLEHVVRALDTAGARPITIVVGHQAEQVEAAFAGRGLAFVRQEPPRGTGHAVQISREGFAAQPERTLLVVNGDLPLLRPETLGALLAEHRRSGAAATILTVELDDPGAYGRVLRDEKGGVRAIVEAKDATEDDRRVREINAGLYAFEVPALLEVLGQLKPQNKQGEYYVTDVVGLLRAGGRRVGAFKAADPGEALGVNTLAELAETTRLLRQRRVEEAMAGGASIEDPATTHIGMDAVVEADAVIRPYTFLEGR